ncbi:MAG TPA: hypothetical protein H9903_06445 [Candidatus Aquabacterium excrementipullorum]|nr:hypothetical protein [Candidatus Aquabacterium excrementipullorum]
MKLRVVPASQGLQWVKNGIGVCAKQPWGFLGMVGLVATATLLLTRLPAGIGHLVMLVAAPLIWMSFILASRRVLSDRRIAPLLIGELVKEPEARRRWLKLGSLYAATLIVAGMLAWTLGPGLGTLFDATQAPPPASAPPSSTPQTTLPESPLNDPALQAFLPWWVALTIPVSLVFWHTPALVYWGRMAVGKALFFSAVASWRNLGAFAVYGACWVGLLFTVGMVMQVLALVVPSPPLMTMTLIMAVMWVFAAFYASLYFSVVDCFESRGTATEEDEVPPSPDEQRRPPDDNDLPE